MLDPVNLRLLATRACGVDPGALSDEVELATAGWSGVPLLLLVHELEETYRIELPLDLIGALETVGDIRYFVQVKVEQRVADEERGAAAAGGRRA